MVVGVKGGTIAVGRTIVLRGAGAIEHAGGRRRIAQRRTIDAGDRGRVKDGVLYRHHAAQRVVEGGRPCRGVTVQVGGCRRVNPATARCHLERHAREGAVRLVIVDGEDDGVVGGIGSRRARLDRATQRIVEGMCHDTVIELRITVALKTGQDRRRGREGNRTLAGRSRLGGVTILLAGLAHADGAIAVVVIAIRVACDLSIGIGHAHGQVLLRLVIGGGAALAESIGNGGGLRGETIIGGTGGEAPGSPVGREIDRGCTRRAAIVCVEVAIGGADAVHGSDDVAIGIITCVGGDGALARIAAIAVSGNGGCHTGDRRGCSRCCPFVVHKVFALPDMSDGAAAVETIHFAVRDLVDGVIAGSVRGGIRPLLLHGRPVGTGHLFALQVVIAIAQTSTQAVIIIGVISLDPRRGRKAPTFHVRGFRRNGRNQAGNIRDIERTIARTGRGVIASIRGCGLLQQGSGAVATVHILLVHLPGIKVAAIAAACGPALGTEIRILTSRTYQSEMCDCNGAILGCHVDKLPERRHWQGR